MSTGQMLQGWTKILCKKFLLVHIRVAFFEYLSPTGKNSQKPVSNINANITAEIQTDIARKGKLKGKA